MLSAQLLLASISSSKRSRLARAVAFALLIPFGACSSLDNFNIFKLFDKTDEVARDEPADKLYNEGVYLLNEKKSFKDASKKFEEVDRQHPYSEQARKALIMSAYTSYQAGDYDETITTAKRYVSLHPGSSDAAYAQFLIGSSYFERMPDVSRDQTKVEKGIAAFEEVVRKYPNSEYTAEARRKIEIGKDQLAAKEMDVGRWNMQKKNFTGAINRFKVVVTQYQTTRHVEEALARLTECYMTLGIVPEAQTAAAILGHNFPESPWYKDAYSLVKSGGFEPTENSGSWMSKAFKRIGLG
jgi:outer membrane protein assembly factor BamD